MLVENNEIGSTGLKRSARTFMTHCQGIKRGHLRTAQKHMLFVKDKLKTTVEVNRNILGALLSFSVKANQPIDFDSVLPYPLSPIPLSFGII